MIRKGRIRCKSGSYISKHVVYGEIVKVWLRSYFRGNCANNF